MSMDWRKSKKANELREYIDKVFKPRKEGMKNLDREIIVDFIALELAAERQRVVKEIWKDINTLLANYSLDRPVPPAAVRYVIESFLKEPNDKV
jgi:hypothetical protein